MFQTTNQLSKWTTNVGMVRFKRCQKWVHDDTQLVFGANDFEQYHTFERFSKSLGRGVLQYLLNMFWMIWIQIPLHTIPQVILQLVLQGHFCTFQWFSITRLAGSQKNFASLASFALLGHCNSCWISACTNIMARKVATETWEIHQWTMSIFIQPRL